jgi:PEP-CTERM motif
VARTPSEFVENQLSLPGEIMRHQIQKFSLIAASAIGALALLNTAHAATVAVTVTVQNLAPTNSISFAPLRLGFNNGTFDAFNLGQVATAPIISVAEGGSGAAWLPAFAAADPTATLGSVNGLLTPGSALSATFNVDSVLNPFFTFAAMAVPSNDFFIGNDSPTEYRLFDAAGNLAITSISQKASEIWDAGSESFDPAAAAFVGTNSLRTPQNSVVSFNFAELSGFNGLTTGAGYVFNSALTADSDVYRISFAVAQPVPEPETYALMAAGLMAVAWVARKKKKLGATTGE